jgi:glycosyltransferase involved in cell wall biosynthesis
MELKSIVVCSEIPNPKWRWLAHHYPDSYNWSFCRAKKSSNKVLTMAYRTLTSVNAVFKARKADVIVSHGPYMAFYCAFFIWLFRIKTLHVSYSFNFAELPRGMALKRMKLIFKKIDCLVVSSEMERDLYADYFDIPIDAIDFVRWGVAEPDFNLTQLLSDIPYVSAVGGNSRDYRAFMAAMKELPEIPAITVMRPHNLVGLDVPSNVKVLVNTSKDEALSIIKNSAVSVLPLAGSETPCGHVTIVVAMYLGVPCVVTDSSGVSDYVTHEKTGLLCKANSVDALSESISRLLSDIDLRSDLAKNAEEFVRKECSENNYVTHLEQFSQRATVHGK